MDIEKGVINIGGKNPKLKNNMGGLKYENHAHVADTGRSSWRIVRYGATVADATARGRSTGVRQQ